MKLTSLTLILTLSYTHAAFTYDYLYTDSAGNFGDPSTGWSGPASQVVANAGKPFGAQAPVSNHLLLDNATSGDLTLGATNAFVTHNGLNTGIIGTMSIDVGAGGTFDLDMTGSWANTNLKFGPNQFGLFNLTNVNSFTVEFTYSEPIAADVNAPPTNGSPFIGAFQAFAPGSSNYDLSISYVDLVSSSDGTTFNSGLNATAETVDMTNSLVTFAPGTTTASGTNLDLNKNDWHGTNAIDIDPTDDIQDGVQNNGTFEEAELVYASGIRYTLSRTDGANFDAAEKFIFSGNGNQWNDTEAASLTPIPEPTALSLSLLAGLGLLSRRKR